MMIVTLFIAPLPVSRFRWRRVRRASAFRPIVENKKPVSFTMGADPDSESWDNRKHAKEKV
jgi:hypothetical protein